jgi:hypothetical protein
VSKGKTEAQKTQVTKSFLNKKQADDKQEVVMAPRHDMCESHYKKMFLHR